MPRTSKVESPGCPPLRALTFDVLGLIKVVEARAKQGGVPSVVERWGEPDFSKCVLTASMDDSSHDPLLAVARKSGMIEVLSALSGDLRVSIANGNQGDQQSEDDNVAGLHIFKKPGLGSSRSCTLLTCSTKGHANLRSVEVPGIGKDAICDSPKTWDVCASGDILCSKVNGSETYAVFGGKGVEVNVWDLDSCTKIWIAKSPAKNSLGIFAPTWFTSTTFLSKDDHRKFVAGTNNHQIRLYDISAQRRPVISFEFRETPIKAVTEDLDGNTIYAGNGSGDLASFDIRTGKLLGCFLGKGAGSIRSMARHPQLPLLASCGLDSYLRFWDVNSRQLLSAVFLKQPLSTVVFDSHFKDEDAVITGEDLNSYAAHGVIDTADHEESLPEQKKTSSERDPSRKLKSKKRSQKIDSDDSDSMDDEESVPEQKKPSKESVPEQKKPSKERDPSKKLKSKKRSQNIESDDSDSMDDEESVPAQKKPSEERDPSKKLKSKKKSKKIESEDLDSIDDEESLDEQKKTTKKRDPSRKMKSKKRSKSIESDDVDTVDDEESLPVKSKKTAKERDPSRKLKSKKRSKKIESDNVDVS